MAAPLTADELRRFAPKREMAIIAELAEALHISEECAIAIRLCQQAMNEWCRTPQERGSVIAALFGIENQRRVLDDEKGPE
jgi:hypothetical protein